MKGTKTERRRGPESKTSIQRNKVKIQKTAPADAVACTSMHNKKKKHNTEYVKKQKGNGLPAQTRTKSEKCLSKPNDKRVGRNVGTRLQVCVQRKLITTEHRMEPENIV